MGKSKIAAASLVRNHRSGSGVRFPRVSLSIHRHAAPYGGKIGMPPQRYRSITLLVWLNVSKP